MEKIFLPSQGGDIAALSAVNDGRLHTLDIYPPIQSDDHYRQKKFGVDKNMDKHSSRRKPFIDDRLMDIIDGNWLA